MKKNIKDVLVELLIAQDNKRARSTQVNVGPSEIGGCGRRLWYRVNGTQSTNTSAKRLSGIMGTAIHHAIDKAFTGCDGYLTEVEVTAFDVTGHIDLIDVENKTIWDWKTSTKTSIGFLGSEGQIQQIQIYAYLARQNGYDIETVGLVGIPRDGNEDDIVVKYYPYDENVAFKALYRFKKIQEQFEPPKPEKEETFCSRFCEFYGVCEGIKTQDVSVTTPIENKELASLIERYKDLSAQQKEVGKELDGIKELLVGTTGITPDGTTIKWSHVNGRESVDEQEVLKLLGFIPKKQGNGYDRMTIK